MVNSFMAGQSSHSLQEQCATLTQDIQRVKQEWSRKDTLVQQLTADRTKLKKEVEDLQSRKAMALTKMDEVKANLKVSEQNRELLVDKCKEETAKSATLEAEKEVLEERNRVQGERIQELEAALANQASREEIINSFMSEDDYLDHVGKDVFHLLRSFAPLFAAKFPPPYSAEIVEGFRAFYEGYYGRSFRGAEPDPDDDLTPEELYCQRFAEWAPNLAP